MSTVTVVCNLTLDGVMQAPGRPDEDRRGGFTRGGWAVSYSSDAMGRVFEGMSQQTGRSGAMLLGRRTYEDFAGFWPNQPDNPFTEALNRMQKYVASATLADPLPWVNSTVLAGDAAKAVAALKDEQPEQDLVILGSGGLIRSLLPHGLIDEFTLLIHPLVLGAGQRLFAEGSETALDLIDSVGTSTGVVLARYRRAK
jgi:dihydrofolate reductase